jgi:transposase
MPRGGPILTDRQWKKIEPLVAEVAQGQTGRRPWKDSRRGLEGILWIARSGARRKDLPTEYASPATCWRRLRDWEEQDVWLKDLARVFGGTGRKGRLDLREAFIDGSLASAKQPLAKSPWVLGRLKVAIAAQAA